MQGGGKREAAADDGGFVPVYERGLDVNLGLWAGTCGDHALIGGEKFSSAVRVVALGFVGTDVDVGRANDLGPSYGNAE